MLYFSVRAHYCCLILGVYLFFREGGRRRRGCTGCPIYAFRLLRLLICDTLSNIYTSSLRPRSLLEVLKGLLPFSITMFSFAKGDRVED